MKQCEVCGKQQGIKWCTAADKYLCYKHLGQFIRYHKFLDNLPRTINDLNQIDIVNDIALIHLYDCKGNEVALAKIDSNLVDKIKDMKWRPTKKRSKTYVISGKGSEQKYLARFLLDYDGELEVDHIDGDELNNTLSNLRIVSRQENIFNLRARNTSKTGIRGVSYDNKHNMYVVDFSFLKNRLFFKPFKNFSEAVYIRYLCEITFLKQFRNSSNDKIITKEISNLSELQKREVENYFYQKAGGLINKSAS